MEKTLIEQRVEDFKKRADDMCIVEGKDYEMEPISGTGSYRIKIISDKDSHSRSLRKFYALMGLASHFQDRSWATARSWCFIIKSEFYLRFTDLPTDQALNE